MINRVVLCGRLTADPQLKYSQAGQAICTFNIAVDRKKKKDGQQNADFPRIVQFDKGGEATANYMSKGSLVGIDGRLSTRTWDDENGKRQYATEVIADSVQFLESKKKDNNQSQPNSDNPIADHGEPTGISDSDLPF